MDKYSDLLIKNGGLSLDVGGEPALTHTRASIAQDIKHMLMESGLVSKLLAQRSNAMRLDVYTEMELLVETDTRLVPGTIKIESMADFILITADTYEFGGVSTQVNSMNAGGS
ncbi:DUF2590 family protein [Shewanella surugensis]|uniref:DUF2590 family protein n=1 Tax=Shewanella surugensis TaxID=212020 RepID=A0ABT0L821_9GAMM|nr:DUF2590 family protein [Shewanella surugensis]MCL1123522.1 DUF2590 family protein [Shewanella surugensis]